MSYPQGFNPVGEHAPGGLTRDDRIVSFAAIGLITSALAKRRFDLAYTYLVFDPGKRSHREAEAGRRSERLRSAAP
jgi:hypothetical protein